MRVYLSMAIGCSIIFAAIGLAGMPARCALHPALCGGYLVDSVSQGRLPVWQSPRLADEMSR